MTRLCYLLLVVAFMTSCSAMPATDTVATSNVDSAPSEEVLPDDYFAMQSACSDEWTRLIAEWRANGGGLKDSIAATRHQIASDRQSKFAELVRTAWAAQGVPRNTPELGSWPITDVDHVGVVESIKYSDGVGISKECQSIAWLDSLLWEELQLPDGSVRRLQEASASMEWESPHAQNWTAHWLFVRLF